MKKIKKWLFVVCQKLHGLFTKEMLLYTLIGEALFWSPLITLAILAIFVSNYYWVIFGTVWAVWVIALPAIPIQILFIYLTKTIITFFRNKLRRKKKQKENI